MFEIWASFAVLQWNDTETEDFIRHIVVHATHSHCHCSSAVAVPFVRPIWVSHMDSACTASQCWNFVDFVDIRTTKNHIRTTSLDHDHSNLLDYSLRCFDTPALTSCEPVCGSPPVIPTSSELHHNHHGHFDHNHHHASTYASHRRHQPQLPPLHLPPVTPLSLSVLPSLQDTCLYHHHHQNYHYDNHHCEASTVLPTTSCPSSYSCCCNHFASHFFSAECVNYLASRVPYLKLFTFLFLPSVQMCIISGLFFWTLIWDDPKWAQHICQSLRHQIFCKFMLDAWIFLQIYVWVLSISCQSTIYEQTNVPFTTPHWN